MSDSKAVFLDVDSSIVENNLRIRDNDPEDEFAKLFRNPANEYPSMLVKPHPGFCVKTKEDGTNTKVFVNICTTDAIPPPKDTSDLEIMELMNSDEPGDFKVPMSIGEVRPEKDKKGDEAKAVDIAINPSFFKKVERSQICRSFFLTIVFQGIENKYGLTCSGEKIILTNRKAFGKLQTHRIQQREIDEKMGKIKASPSPISELTGEKETPNKVFIETISSVDNSTRQPEYRLYKKKDGTNCLIGEFKLPDILSPSEVTLDVGEDRIVLESKSKGYFLDIFVPYCIRNEKCTSTFDKALKILTIMMPLIGG